MTRLTPLWEQAGSYAASVDRRLIGAMWPAAAVSGCAVTVSAGTMNMNIAAGAVTAPAANNTGSVLCYSDAVEVVTSPTAPASGSNRYDVVVCQPRGNDLDGGAKNDFVFQVISGTAAASPAVPATPAGAVALAQVYVAGGSAALAAGNLTDVRPGSMSVYPRCGGRVYQTANLGGSGTWQNLPLPGIDYLTGGMKSNGTGLTLPYAGVYSVNCGIGSVNGAANAFVSAVGIYTLLNSGIQQAMFSNNQFWLTGSASITKSFAANTPLNLQISIPAGTYCDPANGTGQPSWVAAEYRGP